MTYKTEIKYESNEFLIIYFEDVTINFISMLRKVLQNKIKTYAFDRFNISRNDSFTTDPKLKYNFGLLPIKTKNFDEKELKFNISIHNTSNKILDILSDDIISKNENVSIIPGILLTKLPPQGKIDIDLYAILGIPEDNVKWRATTTVTHEKYKNGFKFNIETNGSVTPKKLLEHGLFYIKNKLIC